MTWNAETAAREMFFEHYGQHATSRVDMEIVEAFARHLQAAHDAARKPGPDTDATHPRGTHRLLGQWVRIVERLPGGVIVQQEDGSVSRVSESEIVEVADRPPTETRERQLEMALEQIRCVASAAMDDLNAMQQHHAPSKRGSNYQRALDSLIERLAALESEVREVLGG